MNYIGLGYIWIKTSRNMQIVQSRKKASQYLPKVQMRKFCNMWNRGNQADKSRYLKRIVGMTDAHTIRMLAVRSYSELDSETRYSLELKN